MRAITLDEAVKIINATFAEAKRRNAYPLTAVLLDAGGRMKATMKQDGASLLRFEVAYGKAYAALALGRSSRMALQKAKEKPLFMENFLELADGPMFLEIGAQLIRDKDGEVIGALATTGDTGEVDELCVIAGIRACGFKTDEDFSDADMRRLNIKRGPPIKDPQKPAKSPVKSAAARTCVPRRSRALRSAARR
ncbi:MAG: heme-binding protein [Xanthobacteraceae bacterium]